MPKITNDTNRVLDFVVKGEAKDGVPPTVSIAPGETKDIDVDEKDGMLQGYLHAGAIRLAKDK
jgi:hypothetical protein